MIRRTAWLIAPQIAKLTDCAPYAIRGFISTISNKMKLATESEQAGGATVSRRQRPPRSLSPPDRVAFLRLKGAVLDGFHEGSVSPYDLSRYLGLKLRHLREFEAAVYAA